MKDSFHLHSDLDRVKFSPHVCVNKPTVSIEIRMVLVVVLSIDLLIF